MKTLEKGNKKLLNAWAFYDWANSVYSLVISTAVFPIYYSGITASFENVEGEIKFLGTMWHSTTLYNYTLAFAFLVVIFTGWLEKKGFKLKL
jgi:UMF1 family MFS transporter